MSKINDQIKELQNKLKRVEFLNHILDSAKNYQNKDFADVKDDVVLLLEEFVTQTISAIENSTGVTKEEQTQGQLSQEELSVVKGLVQKVQDRTNGQAPAQNNPYGPSQPAQPKKKLLDANDKLSFAMENRHLAGKRVMVANDQNMQVNGEVVGLDAPHVQVRTDTGPVINVPIEKISVI